ncbi:MAG: glycosyltransferase [Pseudobutyrivibrio sp.]|nr:glycosyltransferase [Pseudobutyrivibrio sp.]
MDGLISIIVPIFNVEQYLDKCVESILEQTYKKIELILVDDGSTDGSAEKCEAWAQKDERIKVIHKENSGSADSRNMGLDIAQGEYIGFVDSDDWIVPDMYERLANSLKDNSADMSVCMFKMTSDENEVIENSEYPTSTYSGKEFADIIVSEKKPRISYAIWKCLYKKDKIGDLRFYTGVHYNEDAVFLIENLWRCDKVIFIDAPLYYYRVHLSSISNVKMSKKHIDDILFKCRWLTDFYQKNGNADEQRMVRKAVIRELTPYLKSCWDDESLKESLNDIISYIQENKLGLRDIGLENVKDCIKYIIYISISKKKC